MITVSNWVKGDTAEAKKRIADLEYLDLDFAQDGQLAGGRITILARDGHRLTMYLGREELLLLKSRLGIV